jgi:hypothetical protein
MYELIKQILNKVINVENPPDEELEKQKEHLFAYKKLKEK